MLNLLPRLVVKNYIKNIMYGKFEAITLFQDISGFTSMTERLMSHGKVGAEVLSLIITQTFEILIRIIYRNEGFISTFAGDAFTAIFPMNEIGKACRAALDIQKYFIEHPIKKTQLGHFELAVKQGLSCGKVDWGIVGGNHYMTFYFRGEAIDGCALSEHHCSQGEVIIDYHFLEKLPPSDITLKEKSAYYYHLEEHNFQAIKWDEVNTWDTLESDEDLQPLALYSDEIMHTFFPLTGRKDSTKAEFREIASVFLSFKEPETFKELNRVVTKILKFAKDFGGYLSSLDFGDKGSLMLILFGAPISYEDNNLRAADFSNNVKAAFKDQVKMGITFGTVFAGYVGSSDRISYTVLGDVVNLSARFMSAARDGQILISEKVYKAVEREFEVRFVEQRLFKGKAEKINVYELRTRTHFEDAGLHTGHFIGREKELKQLNEFCQPFSEHKFSGFIYVYGAPGIGKSRLLFEFTNLLIGEEEDKASLIVLQTDSILKKSLNPFVTYFLEYFDISQHMTNKEKKSQLYL